MSRLIWQCDGVRCVEQDDGTVVFDEKTKDSMGADIWLTGYEFINREGMKTIGHALSELARLQKANERR